MPVIISGKRKGAKLQVCEGPGIRPTLVHVREALFSMLMSELGDFAGLDVLDPFAGAGTLGLEAWSRGAGHVDFVERDRRHFAILKNNIGKLNAGAEVTAILGQTPGDWRRLDRRKYDLVMCDPPYGDNILPGTLRALIDNDLLNFGAIVSLEADASSTIELPAPFEIFKDRKYGKCRIVLVHAARTT